MKKRQWCVCGGKRMIFKGDRFETCKRCAAADLAASPTKQVATESETCAADRAREEDLDAGRKL